MEQEVQKESVTEYWVVFVIAAIVQIIFLIWLREYFWIIMPWVLTSFFKAIRII